MSDKKEKPAVPSASTTSTNLDDPNVIYLHDAYQLISKKILINRLSIELAKTQVEFSNATKKLQQYAIDISNKRIEYLTAANCILDKQLKEFTAERHDQCTAIYTKMDTLCEYSADHLAAINECNKYNSTMYELIEKIQYIESTIPQEQLITNYRISRPAPPVQNCAEELANPALDNLDYTPPE